MSTYEASITNPKKQLEFYKILSEQLQQENKQLKEQYCERTDCAGRLGQSKRVELLESVIEEVREIVNFKLSRVSDKEHLLSVATNLIKVLDKAKGSDD